MSLQSLFSEPILEQRALDPGYDSHASDVWLVRTARGEAVVRASRLVGVPDNDFWWGLKDLFGLDPRQVFHLKPLNDMLAGAGALAVPRVLGQGVIGGRQHVVVEKMAGHTLDSFTGKPAPLLEGLGEGLARIHQRQFEVFGSASGETLAPIRTFHARLCETIHGVVQRYYADQPEFVATGGAVSEVAQRLPAPEWGTLVMPDLDPSQFLTDGQQITALVDTEAYVIGPRELDFIALEYVVDEASAGAIRRGYERVMQLPDLSAVRPIYRFFYRLLRIQGSVPLQEWLDHPAYFG